MLKHPPAPNAAQLAKIEQLEAEAVRMLRLREESWERSDSDGFLSQWANQIGAEKNRKQIAILRNGGYAQFWVLADAEGNVVADRYYSFPNAYNGGIDNRWKLPPEWEAKAGRRWIPWGENSRVQKQLGLHEELRWFPARASIEGGGRGLSGAANAYVAAVRVYEEPVNA